jgi:poly-beta-1,6-N-acetyl-D-glucosamine synthase
MSEPAALGIMAYNEERNIGRLLDSVLGQSALDRIARIVVVASGCTDHTCDIVRSYAERDPRISLIDEPARSGKIAAINRFLFNAAEEILMVSSADLIYEPQAVERLLAPFADPEIGMVGAHSIPLDTTQTFFGYAANLMWSLHHDISMRDPKMGELIAFRNVFRRLNPNAICDELSVYQLVRSAGYVTVYAPDARIYNKGPENLDDFTSQRMHCIVGNLQIMRDHNVPVSTMRTWPVLRAALPHALRQWRRLHWTIAAGLLELYCRGKAQSVYRSQKRASAYRVWDPASSTKSLGEAANPSSHSQPTKVAH